MQRLLGLIAMGFALCWCAFAYATTSRFFLEGDGQVTLHNINSGVRETIEYRDASGTYPASIQQNINKVFGLGNNEVVRTISLRLIALLDYIQDRWGDGKKTIQLASAYRSPTHNESLRAQGKTAAKASMHMEGMAADIQMTGVSGKQMWEEIRVLECCGVGWYGSNTIHIDPGPARFWTGATAKTDTDISEHNKQIAAWTGYDIYSLGEKLALDVVRITEFPLGIARTAKLMTDHAGPQAGEWPIVVTFHNISSPSTGECQVIKTAAEARNLAFALPKKSSNKMPRRLKLHLTFCERPHADTPEFIDSNVFTLHL